MGQGRLQGMGEEGKKSDSVMVGCRDRVRANLGSKDFCASSFGAPRTHAAPRRQATAPLSSQLLISPCPWLCVAFHRSSALSGTRLASCCSLIFLPKPRVTHWHAPISMESQQVSILLLGDTDVGKTTFLSYVLSIAIRTSPPCDTFLANSTSLCFSSSLAMLVKHSVQPMT